MHFQLLKQINLRAIALSAIGAAMLGVGPTAKAQLTSQNVSQSCSPENGLVFLCDAIKPEDMKHIAGTRFIVTSGFSTGAGLKLVDTRKPGFHAWFVGAPDQIALDRVRYPDCATPPDPGLFNARGLSLRKTGRRTFTLHVVNHGGREAIEIFQIAVPDRGAEPQLRWRGCLRMPPGIVGNAVATYRDQTVLVSVLTQPGTTITDFERGQTTGGIFERAPGETTFKMIAGTGLPGNNGLETLRDDRGFVTVGFGLRAIAYFARGATGGPEAIIAAPGFMPDNVHWVGKRLLAAGMNTDEPACGGKRQIVDGVADTMLCPRGWKVAHLDLRRRRFQIIATGRRNTAFNGVSQAVIVKRTLWLGSYQANRIAFLPMTPARPNWNCSVKSGETAGSIC